MRRAKEIARGRGEVRAGSRIKYFSLPPPLVLIELSSKSRRRCRRCRTDRLLRFRGGYTTALSHRLQLRVIGKLPCPPPFRRVGFPFPPLTRGLMEGGRGRRVANVTQPSFRNDRGCPGGKIRHEFYFCRRRRLCMHYRDISTPSGCCRTAWPRELPVEGWCNTRSDFFSLSFFDLFDEACYLFIFVSLRIRFVDEWCLNVRSELFSWNWIWMKLCFGFVIYWKRCIFNFNYWLRIFGKNLLLNWKCTTWCRN